MTLNPGGTRQLHNALTTLALCQWMVRRGAHTTWTDNTITDKILEITTLTGKPPTPEHMPEWLSQKVKAA